MTDVAAGMGPAAAAPLVAGALLCLVAGGVLGGWLARRRARLRRAAWPRNWGIGPRPVFALHERTLHRLLTETLPHHLVLAKLPLLRFCQAVAVEEADEWYERLSPLYVSFAICSPNGRVLVAVDFDGEAPDSPTQKLKQAALQICRIRHVRCRAHALPSAAEILSWVGETLPSVPRAEPATERLERAGEQLAQTVRKRRAERASQWQDSFFAPDSRFDDLLSGPGTLDDATPSRPAR